MPNLYYGAIDPGAPNAFGLKTQAIKFKFKGNDYGHQFGLAEYLARGMQDPAIDIAGLVDFTLDLDGTSPDQAVRLLFQDTDVMVNDAGPFFRVAEGLTSLLEDLVDCGEAFAAALVFVAA